MTVQQQIEKLTGAAIHKLNQFDAVTTDGKIYGYKLTDTGKVKKGSVKRDYKEESIAKVYLQEIKNQTAVIF